MLSDSKDERTLQHAPPPRPPGAKTNVRWSDNQKIEAATTFLMLGSLTLTSNVLKIPHETLKQWRKSEWWQELVTDIKSQENIVLSNKLKKIVDKSLDLMTDRLENGDWIYDNKQGKLVRKPIAAKELNKIAGDMIDKSQILQVTEQVQIAEENIKTRLEKLARSFEEFATKSDKPPIQVTDVVFGKEIDNAVYEERKAGLQEGERSLQQQAGTEESTE